MNFIKLGLLLVLISASTTTAFAKKVITPKASDVPVITAMTPNSGDAGANVLLKGDHLGSTKGQVLISGSPISGSSVSLWSSSQVKFKIPPGKNSVDVTIRSKAGSTSNSLSFTYTSSGSGGSSGSGSGGGSSGVTNLTGFKVLANNDLGMHCVDKDFSVFSILPPFNVVNAQVLAQDTTGKPVILNQSQVTLRYSPIADSQGSINSTSKGGKTNFWTYVAHLYGMSLTEGQGLLGLTMPADNGGDVSKSSFSWNSNLNLFSATGVPIFPLDDAMRTNPYPLMRVTAFDKGTGNSLASVDAVLPVSAETTCSNCHATGKMAAKASEVSWSSDANLEIQARTNVLKIHDLRRGTSLLSSQPVLCASCHYSPALDLAGTGPVGPQLGKPWMSATMHDFHAGITKLDDGTPLFDAPASVAGNPVPPSDQQTCYQCHPGKDTKCLRGAMTDALTCQNCHGDMKAVGAKTALQSYGPIDLRTTSLNRRAWSDEPRCQSCHTGDAVNHMSASSNGTTFASDNIRFLKAWKDGDVAASPFLASNTRFAENDGKLFRYSKGHGAVACEGCHGSTHAIWPGDTSHPNDSVAPVELQGHVGTIAECSTCHKSGSLAMTMNGPHGLHNINDSRWLNENAHPAFYKQNPTSCKTCHGLDLRGTVLSKALADRTFKVEGGTRTIAKGQAIGCYTCHNGPNGGD